MIRISDNTDFVPHLFEQSPYFERCETDADVEIWPAVLTDEITEPSDVFTIFIDRECDIVEAKDLYNQHRALRPNSIFAVTATSPRSAWPFPTVTFWSNLYLTVRCNQGLEKLNTMAKPRDGAALFGGWEIGRNRMVAELLQRKLLDRCFVSLHSRWCDQGRFSPENLKKNLYYVSPDIAELDVPEFNQLAHTETGLCTMPTYSDSRHFFVSMLVPHKLYNRSYVSIVAETESFPDPYSIYLSEKISKPLIAGHPFMVYGAPGYLKYLKSFGFRTFDRWIDESYDEHDVRTRAEKIIECFAKFANQPDSAKQRMFEEMQEVCQHNQRLACDTAFLLKPLVDTILSRFPQ